jgi:hypothetical protein
MAYLTGLFMGDGYMIIDKSKHHIVEFYLFQCSRVRVNSKELFYKMLSFRKINFLKKSSKINFIAGLIDADVT